MSKQQAILITGAAGGVGRALVQLCAARGYLVLAADLNTAGLSGLSGPDVIPIQVDISDDASVVTAFATIRDNLGGAELYAVVHAAAVAPLGSVELTSVAEFDRIHNINTLGALRILQPSLPLLRGHGGRIVLISSLLGRVSSAMVSPYASSKHAVEAIGDAVRRENHQHDVFIVIAEPGVIQTPMFTGQAAEMKEKIASLTPDQDRLYGDVCRGYLKVFEASAKTSTTAQACAARLLAIIETPRPRARYRIGIDAKLMVLLGRLLPDSWLDAIFARALGLGKRASKAH